MYIEDANNTPDDFEDLSTLDRGDDFDAEATEAETDATPRDEKGRFAPKQPAEKDEEVEEETAEAETDEAEAEAKAGDAEDDESEDEELTPDVILKKNYPLRLNKALQQRDEERKARQELETRLKALEEASRPPPEAKPDPVVALNSELEELYEKVEAARLDGDTKTAAQLQRQIDAKNREIVKVEATRETLSLTEKNQAVATYNRMLDHLESTYADLMPDHEDFSQAVVDELQDLTEAYEAKGWSPPVALRKAAIMIFREDPFAPKREAKVADEPKAKPAQKKSDISRAIETKKKTPPATSERGVNHGETSIRVDALSEDEFNQLPESKKKELRGDYV